MVNWIVSHNNRFKAAVTMRSVVNRFSAMGSSDMGWLRIPQYGTKPWWEDPEPYWQQSPLRYASNIHTPLLIEHQENDYRLPIEQAEQLYSALKHLGRTVEMVLYPNESHGMSRNGQPWHRVHRLRTNTRFLDRYLKS
jgi:dipeptidyl aminopeptidase/acylaminoacyl peptidase